MSVASSGRTTARRSGRNEGRRSASRAPAAIHLIPLLLLALLTVISLHAGRRLAAPLVEALADSWVDTPAQEPIEQPERASELAAFTPEVQRWQHNIDQWAFQTGLPPTLIATVIQIESCGDPLAHSGAGALGLFQVMPYHFEPEDNPLAVDTNARAGLDYLAGSYRLADGDIRRTLAGYNGGHGVIHRNPSDWPSETQRYVAWGSGVMADIQQGALPSPTLTSWLAAGGRHLCQQAAQRSIAAR